MIPRFSPEYNKQTAAGVKKPDTNGSLIKGAAVQFGGASGDVFSAICGMQIPRCTASKPSKFAFASDEKSIR